MPRASVRVPRSAPRRKSEKSNLPLYTTYTITINTNKQDSEELRAQVVPQLEGLFDEENFEKDYFYLKRGEGAFEIVEVTARLEVGDIQHRLHAHFDVTFKHPRGSQMWCRYKELREACISHLWRGIYMNVQVSHNNYLQQQAYINKFGDLNIQEHVPPPEDADHQMAEDEGEEGERVPLLHRRL